MARTRELHFEDAIEHHLITSGGWSQGAPADFDRKTALVAKDFLAFVEATQGSTWDELRKHHRTGLESAVLETLVKALDSRGALDLIRHGFKFFGKKIDCAYFKPAHGMNPDVLAKYAENRLVVTRQGVGAFVSAQPQHAPFRIDPERMQSIADILGVPEGTVRSRLHYAMSSLRATLDAGGRPTASHREP